VEKGGSRGRGTSRSKKKSWSGEKKKTKESLEISGTRHDTNSHIEMGSLFPQTHPPPAGCFRSPQRGRERTLSSTGEGPQGTRRGAPSKKNPSSSPAGKEGLFRKRGPTDHETAGRSAQLRDSAPEKEKRGIARGGGGESDLSEDCSSKKKEKHGLMGKKKRGGGKSSQ